MLGNPKLQYAFAASVGRNLMRSSWSHMAEVLDLNMAASRERRKRSASKRRRDRLSSLTDDVLGHLLSFLPTKEAACAAVLSRRWRYVFGSVHTITFEEAEGERAGDWTTWYHDTLELKSCSDELLDNVGAALLCRRRCCAGFHVPLRSLRFAFDSWHVSDGVAVDQWLAYALSPHSRGGELHLDMCFHLGPVCSSEQNTNAKHYMIDSDDSDGVGTRDSEYGKEDAGWRYLLPRSLFSCTALRTLCVTYCRLKLRRRGMAIELPFLETMRLTAISDSGGSIQRLISSCPRLAHLTLESLWKLQTISILDKRLRRFSLRCCHRLTSAHIDASELRSLDYKGLLPTEPLLSLHGSPSNIPSCTIDFCEHLFHETDGDRLGDFIKIIPHVTHLHLHLDSLESRFVELVEFPLFSYLTRLTLRGSIESHDTVDTVRWILELIPNLEVLTLQVMKSDKKVCEITQPDESSFSILCLQRRVREIAIENYVGDQPQKMLARLLLCNALVLERLHVMFLKGLKSKRRNKLEVQMRKWGANLEKIFTSTK